MTDTKKPAETVQPTINAKDLVNELLPTLMALQNMKQPEAPRPQLHAAPPNRRICAQCGQDSEHGCKGEHTKMVVFPQRYPEHGEFFQGVFLNGVRYLSNNDQHEITVPANAANGILQLVQSFENNEQETRIGRKAERYSGVAGPGGRVTPQSIGWR